MCVNMEKRKLVEDWNEKGLNLITGYSAIERERRFKSEIKKYYTPETIHKEP